MQLKVLENSGTLISASDGGAINQGITNQCDGIIRGRYDEFRDYYTPSSFSVFSGHYLCKGINLILEETATFNITPTTQTTTYIVGILAQAEQGNIISAEIDIFPSSNIPTNTWSYTNSEFTGRFFVYLYRLTVDQTGLVTRASLRKYLQTYPTLYENVIKISDNTFEGYVEFIIQFTSTMDKTELEGHSIDEIFVENQAYVGFGYVSSGQAYDDGPGIFKFVFGTQEGCSKEDYRGGGINFSLNGNENFEVLGSRRIN